ncbi:hypothetical protein PspLS_05068 [Pyricularia sp. CBS 133598]|nr:hypothetical protein PspLS_05068 [Pyricularia sp. CBS 133598]
MATPTPMKHAPSQQGRTPGASAQQYGAVGTPPVSTPFSMTQGPHSAAFSPHGPKSSPSHFKRSPANTNTLMGHTGVGGAPVNFDSPSAAAALGALGIGGGLDLGLDNIGAGGLGDLGRTEDDDRLKKLQEILAMLSKHKGRVSEAGLERLAKSIGLETLWEDGTGGSPLTRTLVIAGSALALEIVITNNIVDQVALAFPGLNETVTKHEERASRVLYNDLKLKPRQSPLCKMLDKFAANLERLAMLDKLSTIPGFSCQEALAGMHESLNRLYEWDLERLRADPALEGRNEHFKELTAICARSGHPGMHIQGRVGLTLEYWKEKHLAPGTATDPEEANQMQDYIDRTERTWGLWVGCSAMNVMGYPPARVSTDWLSPAVEKQGATAEELVLGNGPILDWQQPPNTVLPPDAEDKTVDQMAVDGMEFQRLPNVMFTVDFEPPVVMSLIDSDHIYAIAQSQPIYSELRTFDSLLFPEPLGLNPTETRTITRMREIELHPRDKAAHDDGLPMATHKNSLFIYKPVYGRLLTSLPFSHPSQLIDMLPLLRQYALLTTLLEKSFGPRDPSLQIRGGSAATNTTNSVDGKTGATPAAADVGKVTTKTTTTRDDYSSFTKDLQHGRGRGSDAGGDGGRMDLDMAPEASSSNGRTGGEDGRSGQEGQEGQDHPAAAAIDVTLTAHPVPRLQVNFPFRGMTASVVFDIKLNGMVHIVSENILDGGDGSSGNDGDAAGGGGASSGNEGRRKRMKPQDLGYALQVCEDLDEWCEWIRTRLG